MRKSDSLASERMWHIPLSAFCLAVPIIPIGIACHEQRVSAFLPLAVYCVYMLSAAAIFTMIALRLYTMHGVRRFAYDIAIWFLAATLLALPLGAANILASWAAALDADMDARTVQAIRLLLSACLYFELIPMFFVTEGIMALAALVIRKLRVWTIRSHG